VTSLFTTCSSLQKFCMKMVDYRKIAEEAGKSLRYSTLKAEQRDCRVHFLKGNDVFAVLPTVFGKSLCFACLPIAFNMRTSSIIVVVSPLTALMKHQV